VVIQSIIYQPAFGNQINRGGYFIFNGAMAPPQFSVVPTTISIPPGGSGKAQLVARIGDDTLGLSWNVSNIPSWLNVDQTTGSRSALLTLSAAGGTALGTVGTLNFNTNPLFAAPSVASGPLTLNIKVGQPDLQGALLIGGSQLSNGAGTTPLNTAVLYGADSNQFVGVSQMMQPRAYHTSTALQDGTILVAGGISGADNSTALATAELYDPAVASFSSISGGANCPGAAGCMITAGSARVATRLADGKVLITGGVSADQACLASAEVYDPATRTFSAAGSMTSGRCYHTATLLPTGDVLVTGGTSDLAIAAIVTTAELYSPTANTFTLTGNPATPTYAGTATFTGDEVLLNGGNDANGASASAQLYSPASGTFSSIGNMNSPRSRHTSTLLQDGRVLVAGGIDAQVQNLATAEIYDPATRTFTLLSGGATCPGASGCLLTARVDHTDTLLIDGRVFLSGGVDSSQTNALRTTEIFDPATNSFSAGPTFEGRVSHTSAFLRAPSTTDVQSSMNPAPVGQSVTLTATITVSNLKVLNGTVIFYDGSTVLGSSELVSGSASVNVQLAGGEHAVTARFVGNDWYGASTSPVLVQQVSSNPISMTLTSTPNPSQFGDSVTLSASLTAPPAAPAAPTGFVNFFDDGSQVGSVPVTSTLVQLRLTNLSAGAHALTAAYGGDSNYGPVNSNSITQTVNGIVTQTTLGSSANPVAVGAPVTFTAKVSFSQGPGTMPTGRVVFADGGTPINSADIVNGAAVFTTSNLTQGPHQITAAYSGDGLYSPSTSPALAQIVGLTSATVTLTSQTNPIQAGSSTVFTATVKSASATPTGSVTFLDAGTSMGVVPLTQGVAEFNASSLSVGTHNITAVYSGDSNYGRATSNVVQQQVNKAAASVALSADVNPSNVDQPVKFTAVVTSQAGTPTGTITFQDGTSALGIMPLNSGAAVLTTSALAAGSHSITAVYSGNPDIQGRTSNVLVQGVLFPAVATITSSNPNPSKAMDTVVFNVTVTSTGGGTPTGSVTLSEGAVVYGSAPLVNGAAAISVKDLAKGAHSINATYGGDSTHSGATSAWFQQQVN
jgi:hypothetical protein